MAAKIYAAAKVRLLEIWDYTENTWGEKVVGTYICNLIEVIVKHNAQFISEKYQ